MSLPKHVVVIPDGNRRWAKNKNMPCLYGHVEGYKRVKELVSFSKKNKIQFLTIWAFSSDNWKRGEGETKDIFGLIKKGLAEIHKLLKKEETRLLHIGRKDRLPKDVLEIILKIEEDTKDYNSFTLCIAIDYGGEDEIKRAGVLLKESKDKNKTIFDFLDTAINKIPNPDLIIRTGGEKRTSGFMPLQSAYAEYYFSDALFPEFDNEKFNSALLDYAKRERRFGK